MEFLIGFIGALACLCLISGGFVLGWTAKKRDLEHRQQVTAEQLTEKERQFLKDEQEAFNRLQNYSAEVAYNLHPKDRPGEGSDTR